MLVQRHSVRAKTTVYCLLLTAFCLLHSAASAFCFEEAGKTYDINHGLLEGIAKAESNFNPYAINRNNNGTRDIGLMQINSAWLKTLNLNVDLLLSDPCYNLKAGANILRMCIDKYGYTWEAIGCYNAVSIDKRVRYSWKIFNELKRGSRPSPRAGGFAVENQSLVASRIQGVKDQTIKMQDAGYKVQDNQVSGIMHRASLKRNSSLHFSIKDKRYEPSAISHQLNMEAP